MMFPVFFSVKIWTSDNETTTECGLTFAEGYTQAMRKLEKRYGDDLISISIQLKEEDDCYIYSSKKG